MLHSRTLNNKINCLHEQPLRIVHADQSSTFEELLEGDKTFSIHRKNIHSLSIEIYNFLNGLSPDMFNSVFHFKENNQFSLRNAYEYLRLFKQIKEDGNQTAHAGFTRDIRNILVSFKGEFYFLCHSTICEESYSEPSQNSGMKLSVNIANGINP